MMAVGLDSGRVMVVDKATGQEKWAAQALWIMWYTWQYP
jgi:hypothetical protein